MKSPKVYVADSGLLHTLLDIGRDADLVRHPKVGASWEGFGIQAVIDRLRARPDECYFWGTYSGAELDLLVVRGSLRLGFELKRTVSPGVTPSMRIARESLCCSTRRTGVSSPRRPPALARADRQRVSGALRPPPSCSRCRAG